MKTAILENIKGRDLPDKWAKRLGVGPDELVNITIQPADEQNPEKKFNRAAIERVIADIADLPVLDERTPAEILGYDDFIHTDLECVRVG